MEFQVPQFIEREPKIIGPFTFKQFLFLAICGGICAIFYFIFPRFIFYALTALVMGGAIGLMLVKIEGQPIPTLLKNFFFFSTSPKLYLWKKKEISPPTIKEERKIEKKEKETTLKLGEKSRLKNIFTKVELGQRK